MVNGKRHGNGILYSKDGSRYEGSWKDNRPNGLGVYVFADQKFDIGEYRNGLLHGFGRTQFHNGDFYRGYFYKGRMQGLGLYVSQDDNSWKFAMFRNNALSKEFESGPVE